ncbi:hypothetical protein FB451DRAFT_1574506 [Mycena latifolia]|nr:hypothetical protein FB451DRAFT_1574506 [Mycena latifolia]
MWTQKIRTMSTTECEQLANAGDPERMHEFALRAAAGVGLPGSAPDVPRAERYWTRILSSPRATKRNIATAHAHLVWCTGIPFGAEGRSIHIRDCMKAGTHAELAAEMGLQTAPTVILLGRTLERFRTGEPKKAFAKWKHFWAAYDARVAELQAEQDEGEAKRFVRPSRYKCAAPGCPVEASKGNMLRACGGKCEEPYKPRYCTKECQIADRKNHKSMCQPGLKVPESDAPSPSPRSATDLSFTLERFKISEDGAVPKQAPTKKNKRVADYSVDLDGVKVHSSPDQLSAHEMKELAEAVKGLSAGK